MLHIFQLLIAILVKKHEKQLFSPLNVICD